MRFEIDVYGPQARSGTEALFPKKKLFFLFSRERRTGVGDTGNGSGAGGLADAGDGGAGHGNSGGGHGHGSHFVLFFFCLAWNGEGECAFFDPT